VPGHIQGETAGEGVVSVNNERGGAESVQRRAVHFGLPTSTHWQCDPTDATQFQHCAAAEAKYAKPTEYSFADRF